MRIGILGPLRVTGDDGADVEVSGARLRALLARLALDPGRQLAISALTDTLWNGDAQPSDPANAVQSLVSRLRRAVPGVPISSGPGGYRLDLPLDAIDAHLFELLAASGRRALADGDPTAAGKHLRAGLDLWRGPALADLADAHPAVAARLDELRLAAIEDRIDAELRCGAAAESRLVAELEELSAAHPLRERLAALRIRALAAAGRPAAALTAYEEVRGRLADELGADPSSELRDAHLAVLRGEPKPPKPASSRGNLRAALTTFVGRDEEIEQVIKQLGENRLVTLVGPGGAGKTRLASVAAGQFAAASSTLAGGVWLVELAPVTDPGEVSRAVLDAVGRSDPRPDAHKPGLPRDTMARLVELLAPTDTLLVLDNCEHVIEAAARLADDLLAACPRLRVLATSREPLAIVGEVLTPVPPLRLPTADAAPSEALTFAAVQLLADRAAAVRPGFSVTDDNVRAVVEICRRLDGLPLAIELAAARLRALSPAQVADRLDDRFRLLTGGSRTALPRHRTLRAVVAWSWDLLTEDERRLAERLAVFPSTVTPESAAGVTGLTDATEVLDALVDKSLLQVVSDGRFRMLETIREYGLEKLAEAGAVADAQRAHTAYFLSLLQEAEPHLRTARQLPWLDLLDVERENIYGAMHFACDAGDSDSAMRMGALLMFPLSIRDDFQQSASLLDRVLALPGPAPAGARAVVRAMTMISRVFSGSGMPEPGAVDRLIEEVRRTDPTEYPFVLLIEPMVTLFTDDTATGLAAVERGLATDPDNWMRAMLHMLRGQIEENDGDAEGMLHDQSIARELFRETGERWGLSMCLAQLADAHTKRGDYDAAAASLSESLALARQVNAEADAWYQQIWLAALRARRGDVAGARAELTRLVDEVDHERDSRSGAWALLMLGDLSRQAGDLDEARSYYTAAWDRNEAATMSPPQFRALLKAAHAYLALECDSPAEAHEHLVEAAGYALDGRDMPVVAAVGVATATYWAAAGSPERAAEVLGAADKIRGHPDRSNQDAERLVTKLRTSVGDAAFEAAYSRGRASSRVEALKHLDPAS
ncbi:ATP-binding protein [Virgisporangium aurantiacum]|uniref:SARP family transcriptional regulator n=1 Tax=Virgisporangium aurantiacum TaxID=175570 RepID=A0A8J4E577_9ACTN|nr:BTAD domain-containing putative transcriptional regulator [Virgisporangium aurantiacum]GIJ61991.1 SARP family transcriptional regulator [Virgisporangium aurantiacum]